MQERSLHGMKAQAAADGHALATPRDVIHLVLFARSEILRERPCPQIPRLEQDRAEGLRASGGLRGPLQQRRPRLREPRVGHAWQRDEPEALHAGVVRGGEILLGEHRHRVHVEPRALGPRRPDLHRVAGAGPRAQSARDLCPVGLRRQARREREIERERPEPDEDEQRERQRAGHYP